MYFEWSSLLETYNPLTEIEEIVRYAKSFVRSDMNGIAF